MYETILVPTDGSEHAHRAARHAGRLADAHDSEVHVLGVVDLDTAGGPFDAGGVDPEHRQVFEAEAETWVRETADLVDADPTSTAIREGHPAETIAEFATEVEADLLAMGTHGRTGVGRYVLGSVTERVLRMAAVPVFTVSADDRGSPGDPFEDVLVPTDGSERASVAVPHGLALAGVDDGRVHAVSVVDGTAEVTGTATAGVPEPGPALEDLREGLEERASDATTTVAEAVEEAGHEAVTAVRWGHPAEELLAYVDEAGIDAVAMGTQGRTGLNRYLLGSTTERVVRHAPVPVVAVDARDEAEAGDVAEDGTEDVATDE